MDTKQIHNHLLIDKDDSLLLIVDIQERLIPAIADNKRLVENVVKLVHFSHIVELPMLVTEQQKLGETAQEIRETLKDYSPVSKVEFDCFGSQTFRERVGTFKRKTLVIVGIEAHICVAQTALHALSDYKVHVVSDAISSRTIDNKKVALFRMGQAGVTITSTEMVMYELLKKAGTDTFREVLKLVK